MVPPELAAIHTDKDATNGILMMCSMDGITSAQGWTCFLLFTGSTNTGSSIRVNLSLVCFFNHFDKWKKYVCPR